MAFVLRGRHIEYASGNPSGAALGTPIIVHLPEDECPGVLEFVDARHIDYSDQPQRYPILATALTCCPYYDHCPRVFEDLFPGGIWSRMYAFWEDVSNCASAQHKRSTLLYCCLNASGSGSGIDCGYSGSGGCPDILPCPPNPSGSGVPSGCPGWVSGSGSGCFCEPSPGHGKWRGSVTLRGGTLNIEVCYVEDSDPANPQFTLAWSGCDTCCEKITVFAQCADPIMINFGNITVDNCCDCLHSTEGGIINLFVVANCHPTVLARHIDYTDAGVPIVAQSSPCPYAGDVEPGCDEAHCGLHATVTNVDGCDCLAGDYILSWVSIDWEAMNVGDCHDLGDIKMVCRNNFDDKGRLVSMTLQIDVVCGATNTGTAEITLDLLADPLAMEDLDVTFDVTMTDPSSDCSGTCFFTWNAMDMSWHQTENDCVGGGIGTCDCVDPLTIPPGSFDGQTVTLPCVASAAPSCCVGHIQIRVTR